MWWGAQLHRWNTPLRAGPLQQQIFSRLLHVAELVVMVVVACRLLPCSLLRVCVWSAAR
jgi:hypothetical protein